MDMRLINLVTPTGMDGVNQSHTHSGIDSGNQFLHGLSTNPWKFIQEPAFPTEERPKGISGGQSNMQVRNFQDVFGDIVDPVTDLDFAARGTEAGLT